MGLFSQDKSETTTTTTTTIVQPQNAATDHSTSLQVNAWGKGAKTVNVESADKDIVLAALASANNLAKTAENIFTSSKGSVDKLIESQSDILGATISSNSGAYSALKDLAETKITDGGNLISKNITLISIVAGAVVVAIFLFRSKK